jgi:hypothetical protein
MRTLILSAVLYLSGVAGLLLFRPKLMFKKDGTWKEFGTVSDEHSIFPFWLFCIVWAIVSYLVTLLLVGEYSTSATVATSVVAPVMNAVSSTKDESPEDAVEPLPLKTSGRRSNIINKSMEKGYHMLNENATKKAGTPQYVYVGNTELKKPGYYVLNDERNDPSKPKYVYVGNERPVDATVSDEE